jgi:hypothetical protein
MTLDQRPRPRLESDPGGAFFDDCHRQEDTQTITACDWIVAELDYPPLPAHPDRAVSAQQTCNTMKGADRL